MLDQDPDRSWSGGLRRLTIRFCAGLARTGRWQRRRMTADWSYRTEHVTIARAVEGVYPARTPCCRTEQAILCDRFQRPARPPRALFTPHQVGSNQDPVPILVAGLNRASWPFFRSYFIMSNLSWPSIGRRKTLSRPLFQPTGTRIYFPPV